MSSGALTTAKSSFGQTLHFITDIKLQELEKQRLAYQAHAKVLKKAQAVGEKGDIIRKVEILAHGVESWTGSGKAQQNIVGGSLQLDDLKFWLLQAKHDPSFSHELAEGWARTLEEHIRHNMMRFDSAKHFGTLFNEWLASGDSVALAYQAASDDVADVDAGTTSETDFVEVGRKEMYEQKAKLTSIIFDDYPIDVSALKAYLEDLFSSNDGTRSLENLRKDLKQFGLSLQRHRIGVQEVKNSINGLLASGLMDEEKRTTLKAFLENPTVLQEVESVLNMRLAGIESWAWPKEGILVEFRRHMNGKYRAFTDPEIVDALLLQYVGVAWQVKLEHALKVIYGSKAWIRPTQLTHEARQIKSEQLRRDPGTRTINAEREKDRREKFFLTQLQDRADVSRPYDDLGESSSSHRPNNGPAGAGTEGPVMVKQRLLHMMATECYLNTAIHGTHAAVCSDLEWFGPSLPHSTILTVLEFMGMSKVWLSFVKEFLSAPIRFPGESEAEPRIRKRGTPISYALSVLCGEAVIFVMDFAVNQKAEGLYLYRMHDDLWLWDATAKKVADGWKEMNKYASLVGLKFNASKTGSAYIGEGMEEDAAGSGLPEGDIHWGFLKFSTEEKGFVIDQEDISKHVVEMKRQLAKTKSVFGWVNTYNKYTAFIFRNLGGIPANCFSQAHLDAMIDTLGRIQRELFSDGSGSAVGYLRKIIAERFGVNDLPEGYFYFPISSGGLELRNTMLELLALEWQGKPLVDLSARKRRRVKKEASSERSSEEDEEEEESDDDDDSNYEDSEDDELPNASNVVGVIPVFSEAKAMGEHKFQKRAEHDLKAYAVLKDVWDNDRDNRYVQLKRMGIEAKPFMSFEEYSELRESWLTGWGDSYRHMLELPRARQVREMPKVREMMQMGGTAGPGRGSASGTAAWKDMDWYAQWVVAMYGEEVVKRYGGLNAVDPNLIPVGMVQLFKTSRIKLDQ